MLRILLLFGLLFCLSAQAQIKDNFNLNLKGIKLGYRSHFGGMKEYAEIKEFYNDNRPWLDSELGTSGSMNGIEIGMGTLNEKGTMSLLSTTFCWNKDAAKGTSNNTEYKRVVKARYFGIETIDIGLTPLHWKGFNFGGGIMPLGLHFFTFNTTLNGEKPEFGPYSQNAKVDAAEAFRRMTMNHNIHIDITRGGVDGNTGIHFQFFFQFASDRRSTDNELLFLNMELNPNTYEEFHKRSLMRADCFGIKLMLLF